jgi:hypothetical protein
MYSQGRRSRIEGRRTRATLVVSRPADTLGCAAAASTGTIPRTIGSGVHMRPELPRPADCTRARGVARVLGGMGGTSALIDGRGVPGQHPGLPSGRLGPAGAWPVGSTRQHGWLQGELIGGVGCHCDDVPGRDWAPITIGTRRSVLAPAMPHFTAWASGPRTWDSARKAPSSSVAMHAIAANGMAIPVWGSRDAMVTFH